MPLTLIMAVLGRHIPELKFLEVLLGDQPALSPAEYYYQRLLAGNLDDSLDQALTAIDNSSLAQYYDDVLLPALRLADNDIRRGALDRATAAQLALNTLHFVEDLADTDTPEEARPDGVIASPPQTVICLAGPGALDDTVTTMLSQLLAIKGIRTELHTFSAISRRAINALDLSGGHKICLMAVNPSTSSPRMRTLIQRIQQKTATMPVIGLTSQYSDDGEARPVPQYVETFAEAVSLCSA
jgi:hypothetical protein